MVLANSTDGSYQSTVGNIVQTNNSQLNTIFQNFNVDKYEGQYIRFNCNVNNLKTALQNLSGVVSNVFDVQISGAYLDNPEFFRRVHSAHDILHSLFQKLPYHFAP